MRIALPLTAVLMSTVLLCACATDTVEDRRVGQQIVCHKGKKTLTLSSAGAWNHMQHGDAAGPCPSDN